MNRLLVVWAWLWALLGSGGFMESDQAASAQEVKASTGSSDATAAGSALATKLATAFNLGNVDEIAKLFLPEGELIDEQGNIYQGRDQILALLKAYFEKHPGAKMSLQIDSVRSLGPVVVMEGSRTMSTKDNSCSVLVQFSAVLTKSDAGWMLATLRDFVEPTIITPNEALQSLSWMIGEWVNEGSDARVKLSYQWSPDTNFILGNIEIKSTDGTTMTSLQRIGWDARMGKLRSWIFDSDGGFGESIWTGLEQGWLIRSSAVTPDGETGSARIELIPTDANRYTLKGTDRMSGDMLEPDYEVVVVKQPPQAAALGSQTK